MTSCDISVYPIPANSSFFVSSEVVIPGAVVRIFDQQGRNVYEETV